VFFLLIFLVEQKIQLPEFPLPLATAQQQKTFAFISAK
jgi:hypothetical protein